MPNFSSLARLEVPEKFLWGGWVGGVHSHFHVKPNRCVVLCWGWGFDNSCQIAHGAVFNPFSSCKYITVDLLLSPRLVI